MSLVVSAGGYTEVNGLAIDPALRDLIADKIEAATGEENKTLILLHLKK
ncbi:MAG: hypothetical protein HN352_01575 [Bacteroidetes bacterium]|jgi:hypothetical protein|nr:hypothetical protein [Bacteroidota bacterium]MBT3749458.1 hypothetical protein [Bacteroidota bacterium]MBT4400728.1 hypothetical protein [Bacteroidota bacterium]MBT4408454.1 hypothetical protein [Bacteroidota bacterium]MBT5428096.1 hypothetical protein [Bacteroidota bacterium]